VFRFKHKKLHIETYPDILGEWVDSQWVSHQKIVGAPKIWRLDVPSPTYKLSYIAEPEYDALKNKFVDFNEYLGPNEIGYLGKQRGRYIVLKFDPTANAPFFWRQRKDGPLHFLYYLTDEQEEFLKELDYFNTNLKNQVGTGPENIPSYEGGGDGGGSGDGGAGGGDGAFGGDAGGYADSWGGPQIGIIKNSSIQYRNAFTSDGDISFSPTGIISTDPNVNYNYANSGIYSGSLSSQGNLLAMQLTPYSPLPAPGSTAENPTYTPWLWGYFRAYWDDPRLTTFGANSAIPAITGVVPTKYSEQIPGNLVYWIDLAICRLLGIQSDQAASFNLFYFLQRFNEAIGYTDISNQFIAATNQAEDTNLSYYGSNNYADFVTNGFDIFNQGAALKKAFTNLGQIIQTVPSGGFGTINSIASIMIDKGLGFVNDLTENLLLAGVNLDDIYNPIYTKRIESILGAITAASDLLIIQGVLETSVNNITSPLDYISIEKVSGRPNDSAFATLADAGRKLFTLAPSLTFTNGSSLVTLLDTLRTDGAANLNISTSTSTLNSAAITNIREFLPQTADNQTIAVLNVVGSAAGYYTEQLKKVNDAIAALYATPYGLQLRTVMENISKVSSRAIVPDGITVNPTTGQTDQFWDSLVTQYTTEYFNLLQTIVSDPSDNIQFLVDTINTNYDYICQQLFFEISNYNKANFQTNLDLVGNTAPNYSLWSFVSTLPYYAADPTNIGTDYLLYGLSQNNTSGNIAKAIIVESKNNQIIGQSGVGIKGL
jgi:hypothetical protein